MIKKYLYVGLILVVIAVVIFYSVSSYITSGTPTSVVNVTVPAHGVANVPILVNSSQVSILFVYSDTPTDIYFMNRTFLNGLSNYLSANPSASASNYVAAQNLTVGDRFTNNTEAVKEVYQSTSGNQSGYYLYTVIDSTLGSPSYNGVVNASVVYKAYGYNDWVGRSGEALAAIAAFILGIALLIYGALKKPKLPSTVPKITAPAAAPAKKRRK